MYIDSLKLLLKFNSVSLYEEISATYAIVSANETSPSADGGDAAPLILDDGSGYVMQDDQYFLGRGISGNGYSMGISSDMTFGFWLYPVNYGFATNPTTGNAESITMPLVAMINSSTEYTFCEVQEHTASDNENYMTIRIDGWTYTATSENYDAGVWHLVWMVYDGSSFSLYIDGKQHTISENGSLPASVSGSLVDLYINYTNSYNYKTAKNKGYIDSIFVLNEADNDVSNMQKMANNGIESFVDTDFNVRTVDSYDIFFNDPSTITITSSIDDMSYIYIGRNDGIIMRGSPLLWETRKAYSDQEEEDLLGLTSDQLSNNSISDDGFLEIKSTIVRL